MDIDHYHSILYFSVTPDFTMSRMKRTLSLQTSLGEALNYTLQVTIPAHMLSRCASALPRPSIEPILYYLALCISVFMILGVCVAAYFEADHIFSADIVKRYSKNNSSEGRRNIFDLKTIGASTNKSEKTSTSGHNNKQQSATVNNNENSGKKTKKEHIPPQIVNTPPPQNTKYFSWMKRFARKMFSAAANIFSETEPAREQPLQPHGSVRSKLSSGTSNHDKPTSIVAPTMSTVPLQSLQDSGPNKGRLKSSKTSRKHTDLLAEAERKVNMFSAGIHQGKNFCHFSCAT